MFTVEAYNRHREELVQAKADQDAYDKAERERQETANARQRIAEPILQQVREARARVRYAEQLDTEYVRYVQLAKGDPEIAEAFLRKAYDVPDDWERPEVSSDRFAGGQDTAAA